jgi:hypothetical protein
VGGKASAIEQAGATHDQRTRADPNNPRALIGLLLEPAYDRRFVVGARGRNNYVVGT